MFTFLVFLFVFFEQAFTEAANGDRKVRANLAQAFGAEQKNDNRQEN
jgi:hypothetical protein